jgi:hypothetical protein
MSGNAYLDSAAWSDDKFNRLCHRSSSSRLADLCLPARALREVLDAAQSRPIDGEVIPVRVIEVGDPCGGSDASRFVSELDSLSF